MHGMSSTGITPNPTLESDRLSGTARLQVVIPVALVSFFYANLLEDQRFWSITAQLYGEDAFATGTDANRYVGNTGWHPDHHVDPKEDCYGVKYAFYLDPVDAETGDLLWEMPVQQVPIAAPISYTVDGEQYIAVNAGWGGGLAHSTSVRSLGFPLSPSPRLLVFKLGGSASLPAVAGAGNALVRPEETGASAEVIARGEQLFAANGRSPIVRQKFEKGRIKNFSGELSASSRRTPREHGRIRANSARVRQ